MKSKQKSKQASSYFCSQFTGTVYGMADDILYFCPQIQ